MPLLDSNFLNRCAALHRHAQRVWGRRFLGRRPRLRVAGGTETTGQSDYTSGDDLRYVDWNRCARLDELVTRKFMGTEDHWVYFLVDASASMKINGEAKLRFAQQVTAALAYLAIANQDRVSVTVYADRVLAEFPAARGKAAVPRLWKFLESISGAPAATNLRAVTEQFVTSHVNRGLVVLVSDLYEPGGFEGPIDVLRHRGFEPFIVQVFDNSEADPALLGGVTLHDVEAESARREIIEPADLLAYREAYERFLQRVRAYCYRYGLGVVQTSADVSIPSCLERTMRGAAQRLNTRAGVR